MKKIFTLLVLMAITASVNAYDFEVNSIYYSISSVADLTCSVTAKSSSSLGNGSYSGAVVIPPTVTYEDKTYKVTSISDEAFMYSRSLTAVTIPNSVTTIGSSAFNNCDNLSDVYNLAVTPQSIGSTVFWPLTPQYLHVYSGYKSIYANASGWESFTIKDDIQITKATNLTFDKSELNCAAYSSVKLSSTILPSDASFSELVWSSSDTNIAQVTSDGTIYGFSEGKTTISATTKDGSNLTANCIVNITKSGDSYNYNDNLAFQNTGYSMTQMGSYITKAISFKLTNNGSDCIKLTKLIIKNPNTDDLIASSTDESLLGWLGNGKSKSLTVTIHKDITPVYEYHYLFRNVEYTYCTDKINPSSIEDNINDSTKTISHRYNIDGAEIKEPKKGINILKMSDGTTKKVLVK